VTKTGIVKDKRYMDHWMGDHHPECPERLAVIYAMLEEGDMAGRFHEVPVRKATKRDLLRVHSESYIQRLEATSGQQYTFLDADTQTCAASYEAAVLAAGGLCQAIDMVHSGELQNAFALVRPPGHHAERSQARGFCLFNNVAVGARYAQEILNLHRVLIVDWDLHHGNGTQHSFEDDASILYFSTHQYPYYPGTGALDEIGIGKGTGYTVNVPLSVGLGDAEYVGIFQKILKPIALEFRPDLVLVSAGFDIYFGDPLGGMNVTPMGFAGLTRIILDIAEECCNGRAVLTLEGGYDLDGLRSSVHQVLKELTGFARTDVGALMAQVEPGMLDYHADRVKMIHLPRWKSLADSV
jgi:acetoin utilization deacetylase AcuC-like enzyme